MAKKTKEMAKEIPRKTKENPKIPGGGMGVADISAGVRLLSQHVVGE